MLHVCSASWKLTDYSATRALMKVQHVDEMGPLRHVRDSSMYSVTYLFGGIPPPFPPSLHRALHARAVNLRDVQEPVDRGERRNTVQGMGESYDWVSGQDRFLPRSPKTTQLSLTLSLVVQSFAQRFDLSTGKPHFLAWYCTFSTFVQGFSFKQATYLWEHCKPHRILEGSRRTCAAGLRFTNHCLRKS